MMVAMAAEVEKPTGTLTFLFTDIEGSTRLLKDSADRYEKLLGDHRRSCAKRSTPRASMVGTEGDGCLIVLPQRRRRGRRGGRSAARTRSSSRGRRTPSAASAWASTRATRSLGDEGYVGLAIHHGARIGAAGAAARSCSRRSRRGSSRTSYRGGELRDIGERPLRDLDTPERLFELVIDGTPGSAARPGAIRVLIADDQALVRSGFR